MAISQEPALPPEVAADVRPTATDLHVRYLDTVYGYVTRRVSTVQEAEDVTAEVFAAAVEALPRFGGRSSATAWLIGIAMRKLADTQVSNIDKDEIQTALEKEGLG
ncbi:MAG TPA: sigma factor [Capsulimonadaceae bacterium]|nr:sigma factor [Capsulimonadaceae bacterium]